MVVPSFTTLFSDTAWKIASDVGPLLRTHFFNLRNHKSVFFLAPRTLYKFRVEHLLPPVETLYVCASWNQRSNQLPILLVVLLHRNLKLTVLFFGPVTLIFAILVLCSACFVNVSVLVFESDLRQNLFQKSVAVALHMVYWTWGHVDIQVLEVTSAGSFHRFFGWNYFFLFWVKIILSFVTAERILFRHSIGSICLFILRILFLVINKFPANIQICLLHIWDTACLFRIPIWLWIVREKLSLDLIVQEADYVYFLLPRRLAIHNLVWAKFGRNAAARFALHWHNLILERLTLIFLECLNNAARNQLTKLAKSGRSLAIFLPFVWFLPKTVWLTFYYLCAVHCSLTLIIL